MAVDKGSEDLPWKQIFWAKSTSIPHFVVRMTLARAAPPVYDKKDSCYTGRRQTNYLIQWTQANKLSNTLIINRPLEGYPDGLQSGFALHLVLKQKIVLVDSE